MTLDEVMFSVDCGDKVCYERLRREVKWKDNQLVVVDSKTEDMIPLNRLDLNQCFICVN